MAARRFAARETAASTAILKLDWRGILGLANRSVVADLEARRMLAGKIRELRPGVLLAHYWEDAHPDHVAAGALVDAARFWAELTKTDLPGEPYFPERVVYFLSVHLRLHIAPSFVVDVSAQHEAKIQAVAAYHSQFIAGRELDRRPLSMKSATATATGAGRSALALANPSSAAKTSACARSATFCDFSGSRQASDSDEEDVGTLASSTTNDFCTELSRVLLQVNVKLGRFR